MNEEFDLPDRSLTGTVLVVDNYDSFTFNLVQYLGELGAACVVIRNDSASVDEIGDRSPAAVVISPGPGTPADAGVCVDLVARLGETIPVLGVCLGHQAIGAAYGGVIVRAPVLMHGKRSTVHHASIGVFSAVRSPILATRYHSLIVERSTLPDCLEITAWTDDDIIMGVRHREFQVEGVQFHPESIGTETGHQLLGAFLRSAGVPLRRAA